MLPPGASSNVSRIIDATTSTFSPRSRPVSRCPRASGCSWISSRAR